VHRRKISRILIAPILLVCSCWGGIPSKALGQSYVSTEQIHRCTKLGEAESDAMKNQQWELLVSLGRQQISECRDLFRGNMEAEELSGIALGLVMLGRFDESMPIALRCISVNSDAAYCYEILGEALEGVGKLTEARKAYERAISIGGFDRMNASAIKLARVRLASIRPEAGPQQTDGPEKSTPPEPEGNRFGTGFVVSSQGHILTNNHVVAGCRALTTRQGKPLHVLSRNASSDLALLQADFAPGSVAVFRAGPSPKLGDSVVAFGFPLPGLLSSDGNVSAGILSATSGLQNDVRFVQISAPVQPGNSGGPLFDTSGHVIGVVVAKLDAIRVAQATGDVPQNVNFAVHWSEVRAFLEEAGVPYQKETSQHATSTRNIAAAATRIAVQIECTP